MKLKQHSDQFVGSGVTGVAYHSLIQSRHVEDYILVDCRTNKPRTQYGGIPKLYHAVFNLSENPSVTIFNNMLQQICEHPLMENH